MVLFNLCGELNVNIVCHIFQVKMVRHYVRKTSRQSWSMTSLTAAVNDVKNKSLSLRKAAATYQVPYATIRRHQLGLVEKPGRLGRFQTVLDKEFEDELVKYAIAMQECFYGLSAEQLRRLTYDLADKNGINHPFNSEKGCAGRDWVSGFLRRHPELSFRTPEATSLSRATGFNRVQVHKFFSLLQTVMEANKFEAHRIFNVDETGITTVQKPLPVLSRKGVKQAGKLTSGERGQNTTVVCCMNAGGGYIPPAYIFPRVNFTDTLMKGAPPGSVGWAVKSGWMDSETFLKWLAHFQKHANATVDNKVLLILDNHASHRTLEVVDYARSHGIVILSLPPHTSHKMQPLDKTFFGPLKREYNKVCDHWMSTSSAKRITPYDVAGLLGDAYGRCSTVAKATSGFASTGIFPFNPDIFTDSDYAPSMVTENSLEPVPSTSQQQPATIINPAPPRHDLPTNNRQGPTFSILHQSVVNSEEPLMPVPVLNAAQLAKPVRLRAAGKSRQPKAVLEIATAPREQTKKQHQANEPIADVPAMEARTGSRATKKSTVIFLNRKHK